MSSWIRSSFLWVVLGGWCALLTIWHLQGRYPKAGFYDPAQLSGSSQTFVGTVDGFPSTKWGRTRFVLEGRSVAMPAFHGRLLIQLRFSETEIAPGEHVSVYGELGDFKLPKTPDAFDERSYWASQGVYVKLTVARPIDLKRSDSPTVLPRIHQWAWRFHQRFLWFWFERLSLSQAALVTGMTIGSRELLTTTQKNDSIRAGIYHLVVVSGQNLAILCLFILPAWTFIGLPKRWGVVCLAPILFFYALLVGMEAPVMRALVMAVLLMALRMFGRDVPPFYIWGHAALWMLLLRPWSLFSASFQLSFMATAGLLLTRPLWEACQRIRPALLRWTVESGLVCIGAQAAVWPILLFYFQSFSLAGFLATWVVLPLAGPIMVSGLVVGTVGVLGPNLTLTYAVRVVQLQIQWVEAWIRWASSQSGFVLTLQAPPGWAIALYYLALLFAQLSLARRPFSR